MAKIKSQVEINAWYWLCGQRARESGISRHEAPPSAGPERDHWLKGWDASNAIWPIRVQDDAP
jgi:hypothetical protein